MTEQQKAKALAKAIEARQEVLQEKAEANADFKARLEVLDNDIAKLSHDVLYGQDDLPLEGAIKAVEGLQKLAEEDGAKISMKLEGGEEVVIADGTKNSKKRRSGKEAAAGAS